MSPRDKPKRSVRVRKMWRNAQVSPQKAFAVWPNRVQLDFDTPCFVITDPPPGLKCSQLQRLVEIAAMDITDGDVRCIAIRCNTTLAAARRVMTALGLKPANGGRKT